MLLGLSRWFWLTLIALLAVTAAAIAAPRVYRVALLGSGFMAETLCAGVFVSGREPHSVREQEFSGERYALLRYFQASIDRAHKTVTASTYGIAERTALFRDGLGCTLAIGTSEAALRKQGENLFAARLGPDLQALWPDGERVETGTLPEGVDGAALEAAIDAVFSEPDPNRPRRTRALVVVYQGRIVAERYAPGFDAQMPLIGWSMTKSATNALVGLRVGDGKLAVTDRDLMPMWREAGDPRAAITIDQLLRMTSGLRFDETYSDDLSDVTQMLFVQPDAAAFAANKPLAYPPGTHWHYSSGTSNILGAVLRETFASERAYLRYPRERLFGPLGMRTALLQPDPSGTFITTSFLYASARDWARLGLLFLNDGVWEGKPLLPEGWLAYTTRPTGPAPAQEYGAQVWLRLPSSANFGEPPMPEDAFYMLGHDQQVTAIVPSRDLVVVRLGLTRAGGDWDTARELGPVVNAFPAKKP